MKRALYQTAFGLLAALMIAMPSVAAEPPAAVKSLREAPVSASDNPVEHYRQELDNGAPLPRDFVQQPPLVPHASSSYQISLKFNKCLDCHGWARAQATRSPKISITHFRDAQGRELSSVSPSRYFCMQCHVTQSDARPLVDNTFQRVPGLN